MIVGIFLLGGLVSVVGLIRIHYLTQVYGVLESSPEADTTCALIDINNPRVSRSCNTDMGTIDMYSQVYYWTIIETNVGVLSACLPTFRPIQERLARYISFTKLRNSLTRLISSSSSKTTDIRLDSVEDGVYLNKQETPQQFEQQGAYRRL